MSSFVISSTPPARLRKLELTTGDKSLPPINPFKPEFIIVIFIHYKPRIAVTILDL